jgi:ribosomal protein S18 acetylase RimI-like enzyme
MSKVHLSETDYTFLPLGLSSLSDLLSLQENAFLNIETNDLLRRNSKEVLLDCLINHYTLGVSYLNQIIAFGILYFGKLTKENIGYDLDLKEEEVINVANIKLIIVNSDYYGNGLQKKLILNLEKEAKRSGYTKLACTISPKNIYSLKNFLDCGYSFKKQKIKYDGIVRNIYYKNI